MVQISSIELTGYGQYLLGRARELLALKDDIVQSVASVPVQDTIRLGLAEEFSGRYISRILTMFAELAPHTEVEFTSSPSCALAIRLRSGELDIAIVEQGLEPRQWPAEEILRERLCWVTSEIHRQHTRDVVPVTVSPTECQFRPPWLTECLWRGMVLRTLERTGRKYRIASTSGSTSGQLALVMSGLAVAANLKSAELPATLRHVGEEEGMPALPEVALLMLQAREPRRPVVDILANCIRDVVQTSRGENL